MSPLPRRPFFIPGQWLMLGFVLSVSACFACALLLCVHAYLVLTNQTTIEFWINRDRACDARAAGQRFVNPFDLGVKRNVMVRDDV